MTWPNLPNKSFKEQVEDAARMTAERRASGKARPHSSFWIRNIERYDDDYSDPVKRQSPEYLMRLSQIRRGIANFVRIMTRQDIPVEFSTGRQSYAQRGREGTEKIIISATANPHKFDANVGIALHEAVHLILSKKNPKVPESIPLFEFLKELSDANNVFIPTSWESDIERLELTHGQIMSLIKHVLNFVEDRRCDKWAYNKAVGYRPYYDAMYNIYWNKPIIGERLHDPRTHIRTVHNYLFHTINMTNPAADPTVLPGLTDIWNLVDLPNIHRFNNDHKWDTYKNSTFQEVIDKNGKRVKSGRKIYPMVSLPDQLVTSIEIVGLILKNALEKEEAKKEAQVLPPVEMTTPEVEYGEEEESDVMQPIIDPQNLDIDDMGTEPNDKEDTEPSTKDDSPEDTDPDETDDEEDDESDSGDDEEDDAQDKEATPSDSSPDKSDKDSGDESFEKEIEELLEDQEKMLDGEIEKEDLEEQLAGMITALEGASAELTTVKSEDFVGEARVVVYHVFTEQLLRAPSFSFVYRAASHPAIHDATQKAVVDGLRIGNMLAYKLRIMADETPLSYTRQNHGKIDKRLVSGLGYNSDSVFHHTVIEHMSPVLVHLSVDSSSSMAGEKWENSIRLAVALAQAAHKVKNLDVVISFRCSAGPANDQIAQLLIAYDSRVDNIAKIKKMFPYLNAGGGTPEGLVFEAIKETIVSQKQGVRKFFVNISDGEPCFYWRINDDTHVYQDEPAWNHTARKVREMHADGIAVLSYFVNTPREKIRPFFGGGQFGSYPEKLETGFRHMYGKDAAFIDPQNILDIARTLNQLFLYEK